jgi:hypothetical protein
MSVHVTDSRGALIASQLSDNQGLVFFDRLPLASSCVLEVLASGKVLARVRFDTSKRSALRVEI